MRRIFMMFIASTLLTPIARADEGMWFLMFIERLNQRDMQKMGLQLTAQEIYSINNHSLKDAIVQFNGGCTASIISKDGLVLTNHHCGYEQIAELSTPENNYLRDGFWAKNKREELAPKNLYVRFFVRMDNVTDRILGVVKPEMTEPERIRAISQESAKIQKENDGGGKYVVSVRPFFQGNEYYYFVYQDFEDVRLVGTPPESVGKFGGDTDNWEWPRQTGDFSLFRVYTDRDGNAAKYSAENVPMQAKSHLKVSLKGVQENNFAMILGYPGRTNRWESSFWVDQKVKYAYPAWVEGSKTAMDAMKFHMDKDDAVRLKYASKYSQIANYWKNRQGMIDALMAHKTADVKRKSEKKFAKWANKKENKDEYGNVLSVMADYFKKTDESSVDDNILTTLLRGSSFAVFPYNVSGELERLSKASGFEQYNLAAQIEQGLDLYDNLDIALEKDVLAAMLKLYVDKGKNIADEVILINREYNGDFKKFVDDAFKGSVVGSKENISAFLDKPDAEKLATDPLITLSRSLMAKYRESTDEQIAAMYAYEKAYRTFVKGMRESKASAILYPDANSTLRLTYGKVKSLPADKRNSDVSKNYYTTFKTLVDKYKPNDSEFDMPERMLKMFADNDFGRYADKKDGNLHINFLTDNDITGGNSGSPVMNGKGELIGLAFDGNIEAMAGDVIFDKKLQRTINVDIRYVLWIIDKFSDAKHIVDEMTIVD